MSYLGLFMSLSCLIFNHLYGMELNLKDERSSPGENVPTITTAFYQEITSLSPNNQPALKKDHKKNIFTLFTRSESEPTPLSHLKTSPRKTDIIEDHTNKTSPKKLEASNNDQTSPRRCGIIEDNYKISPKRSPRKSEIIEHNKNKISPRKLETSQENPRINSNISPRKFITDTSDTLEKTTKNHQSNKSILRDSSIFPRSKSYDPHASDIKKNSNYPRTRTTKSKSTNDKPVIFTRKNSSKNLIDDPNHTMSHDSHLLPKENKNNNTALYFAHTDSIIDNLSNPSPSTSSALLIEGENENNSMRDNSPSSARRKEYTLGKFFSKSTGTSDNSPSSSLKKPSKPVSFDEKDIISILQYKDDNSALELLKTLLQDSEINLNQQNTYGMTALHYAALNAVKSKNGELIQLLLRDPRLDSTIKNKTGRTASELIQGDDFCDEIRKLLFARITLDKVVFREMFILLIDLHIKNHLLNDKCINETIEVIKMKIRKTETSQGSSELPEEAKLPSYATDEFINKMIFHRIPQDAITTETLIRAIHKEIHGLLLSLEINNLMILESATTIMNLFTDETSPRKSPRKKSNMLFLPPYADYDFIFNIIQF